MAENKVHQIKRTIQQAVSYIINPEKTNDGLNVISRNVIPEIAGLTWSTEMDSIADSSSHLRGEHAIVQGYHFIQSFKGNEVDEQQALELTKQWIESIVPEGCGYVMACHNDKPNIHVHVIVSSADVLQNKVWHPSFIKELNVWKIKANRINKAAGLSIIERPGGKELKTYYEWQLEKKGMSQKKYIRKCIDAAIPKVSSYRQLCDYLRCFGFEIEDGLGEDELETGEYKFSLNIKMFYPDKEEGERYYVRIPYTSQFMYIDKSSCHVTSDGKTFFTQISLDKTYTTYTKEGREQQWTGKEIASHLEQKSSKRKGLRIKTPDGKKFFRERNLGTGYTIDDITRRIEEDGRILSDPEIERFIRSHATDEQKTEFFSEAGVPKYSKSEWSRMSRKEKYFRYRTERIQKIFDEHYFDMKGIDDLAELESMKEEKKSLLSEIDDVNKDLRKVEKELEKIYQKMFEMEMVITQKDINDFVAKNLTPLRNDKNYLKQRIKELSKRIARAEKAMKERDRNKSREDRSQQQKNENTL